MSKTSKPAAPETTRVAKTRPSRNAAAATPKARARAATRDVAMPRAPEPILPVQTPPRADEAPAHRTQRVRQNCRLTTAEYAELTALKKRAAALARPMKRGRLLRAGLLAMQRMSDAQLFALLDALPEPADAAS